MGEIAPSAAQAPSPAAVFGRVTDELSTEALAPAGSTVAAHAVALATALIENAASRSRDSIPAVGGVLAQAAAIRRRAVAAGELNRDRYQAAADALRRAAGERESEGSNGHNTSAEIGAALTGTRDALVKLLDLAVDSALLAELVASEADPANEADAVVAALLAEGAARSAAHLIEINLLSAHDAEVVEVARGGVATAAAAAERARRWDR